MADNDERLAKVSDLVGLCLSQIIRSESDDKLTFIADLDGRKFEMYHWQDCCENVWLEDVTGDLDDLLHSEILVAEERTEDGSGDRDYDSRTWTFYEFRTHKGSVTLRWCGESNGYYSESVDLYEVRYN